MSVPISTTFRFASGPGMPWPPRSTWRRTAQEELETLDLLARPARAPDAPPCAVPVGMDSLLRVRHPEQRAAIALALEALARPHPEVILDQRALRFARSVHHDTADVARKEGLDLR